jgi:hypothetical protein
VEYGRLITFLRNGRRISILEPSRRMRNSPGTPTFLTVLAPNTPEAWSTRVRMDPRM